MQYDALNPSHFGQRQLVKTLMTALDVMHQNLTHTQDQAGELEYRLDAATRENGRIREDLDDVQYVLQNTRAELELQGQIACGFAWDAGRALAEAEDRVK